MRALGSSLFDILAPQNGAISHQSVRVTRSPSEVSGEVVVTTPIATLPTRRHCCPSLLFDTSQRRLFGPWDSSHLDDEFDEFTHRHWGPIAHIVETRPFRPSCHHLLQGGDDILDMHTVGAFWPPLRRACIARRGCIGRGCGPVHRSRRAARCRDALSPPLSEEGRLRCRDASHREQISAQSRSLL